MTYRVILIKHDEGYTVKVPELPGCISEGDSEEEALANIKDAIREYLAAKEELERRGIRRELEVTV